MPFRDVASAGATTAVVTATCSKPTGVAQGDKMLAVISWGGNDLNMTTVPAPFVLVGSTFCQTGLTHYVYEGVAGASEPLDYSWTRSTSGIWSVVIVAYSGVLGVMDASAMTNEGAVSDATIAHPALTTTNADDILVGLFSHTAGNTAGVTYTWPDATYNVRATVEPVSSFKRNAGVADKQLSTINSIAYDVTASLSGAHGAHSIALAPSGDTTPPAAPTGLTAVKSVA